jgi:triosephosphate isomerase
MRKNKHTAACEICCCCENHTHIVKRKKTAGDKLFVANFKMNKTNTEIAAYFAEFPVVPESYKNKIVFCVPATALYFTSAYIKGSKVFLGAQNLHYEKSGPFTGEISAEMLDDCNAEYVIIGHSERRVWFNETDHVINKKIAAALAQNLTVILCIGETKTERENGETANVLSRQVEFALRGIDDYSKIIVAYEPNWAIGSDDVADEEQIAEVIALIKKIIDVPILYGGSANEQNADKILSVTGISGLLVGGASLNPKRFAKICGI